MDDTVGDRGSIWERDARFLHACRVPDVPPGEAPLFVCCRPILGGTIPLHPGCTLKVPYGAVSGICRILKRCPYDVSPGPQDRGTWMTR